MAPVCIRAEAWSLWGEEYGRRGVSVAVEFRRVLSVGQWVSGEKILDACRGVISAYRGRVYVHIIYFSVILVYLTLPAFSPKPLLFD